MAAGQKGRGGGASREATRIALSSSSHPTQCPPNRAFLGSFCILLIPV
jgi:hypothetical protein